jgi:hypothetical protein
MPLRCERSEEYLFFKSCGETVPIPAILFEPGSEDSLWCTSITIIKYIPLFSGSKPLIEVNGETIQILCEFVGVDSPVVHFVYSSQCIEVARLHGLTLVEEAGHVRAICTDGVNYMFLCQEADKDTFDDRSIRSRGVWACEESVRSIVETSCRLILG